MISIFSQQLQLKQDQVKYSINLNEINKDPSLSLA